MSLFESDLHFDAAYCTVLPRGHFDSNGVALCRSYLTDAHGHLIKGILT